MNKLTIFITAILVIVIATFLFGGVVIRDGTATDAIARISYEGLIWKTWGVQLLNDHPTDKNEQKYGVIHDDSLVKQLQQYQNEGKKVRLYFHGYIWVWPWDYSDREVIYKAELLG